MISNSEESTIIKNISIKFSSCLQARTSSNVTHLLNPTLTLTLQKFKFLKCKIQSTDHDKTTLISRNLTNNVNETNITQECKFVHSPSASI